MAGRTKSEVGYRVWFEGERAVRSRRFGSRSHASQWAIANQPNRPFEVFEERPGVARRLVRRLRKHKPRKPQLSGS
jgi:hypothetical protein